MNARTAPTESAIAVPAAASAPTPAAPPEPVAKPARRLRKAMLMLSVPLLLVAGVGGIAGGWYQSVPTCPGVPRHRAPVGAGSCLGGRR